MGYTTLLVLGVAHVRLVRECISKVQVLTMSHEPPKYEFLQVHGPNSSLGNVAYGVRGKRLKVLRGDILEGLTLAAGIPCLGSGASVQKLIGKSWGSWLGSQPTDSLRKWPCIGYPDHKQGYKLS